MMIRLKLQLLVLGLVLLNLGILGLYHYNVYTDGVETENKLYTLAEEARLIALEQALKELPQYKFKGEDVDIENIKEAIRTSTAEKLQKIFPKYSADGERPFTRTIPIIFLGVGIILLIYVIIPNKCLNEALAKLDNFLLALFERITKKRGDFPLSPQEEIIKNYHCSKMVNPRCDGFLTVTNRRVVFHGYAKRSRIAQELKIENVSGISTFYGRVYLKLAVAIAIVILAYAGHRLFFAGQSPSEIVTFLSFTFDADLSWMSRYKIDAVIMAILAGAFLYFCSWRQTFVLKIYSSQATSAPITLGEGYGTPWGNHALQTLTGYPTGETDLMMRELGVLIQDIQTYHDEAIAMWKSKAVEEDKKQGNAEDSSLVPAER